MTLYYLAKENADFMRREDQILSVDFSKFPGAAG